MDFCFFFYTGPSTSEMMSILKQKKPWEEITNSYYAPYSTAIDDDQHNFCLNSEGTANIIEPTAEETSAPPFIDFLGVGAL